VNAQPQAVHRPIQRQDLEAKIRELHGEVEETRQSAATTLVTVGAVVAVGVVAVAYLIGRHKGRKRTTVVEVHRL
jgi:1-aminocyclopropane-1-carboxylate deaminase/D-cysteine desulfhydrase-like pyridoxal-dependent ACC family enzyme